VFRDDKLTDINILVLEDEIKHMILDSVIPPAERRKSKESEKAWEARFEWINQEKETGNAFFKDGRYQEAINQYIRAYCGSTGFSDKQNAEDSESIKKDIKSPLLNNIAMCLIKLGKLQRAIFFIDMIVTGSRPLDPENFKAWKRKIDTLIALKDFKTAQAAIAQAERHTESIQEKTLITNMYRDLATSQGTDQKGNQGVFNS
jgi:tetratricopeptide (TPR) repeat protein